MHSLIIGLLTLLGCPPEGVGNEIYLVEVKRLIQDYSPNDSLVAEDLVPSKEDFFADNPDYPLTEEDKDSIYSESLDVYKELLRRTDFVILEPFQATNFENWGFYIGYYSYQGNETMVLRSYDSLEVISPEISPEKLYAKIDALIQHHCVSPLLQLYIYNRTDLFLHRIGAYPREESSTENSFGIRFRN